jgi:C_GCAxxG_C_C family probable redox protein
MDTIEKAVTCFQEGFSCSQAILSSFSKRFGLGRKKALKIAQAFGGGIAQTGQICGAVSGALMVIGLKHGRIKAEDQESKEKTYELTKEFMAQFKAQNGSIICRELLGYDISTPEGMEASEEKKLFDTICPEFVQSAAKIIEDIL